MYQSNKNSLAQRPSEFQSHPNPCGSAKGNEVQFKLLAVSNRNSRYLISLQSI